MLEHVKALGYCMRMLRIILVSTELCCTIGMSISSRTNKPEKSQTQNLGGKGSIVAHYHWWDLATLEMELHDVCATVGNHGVANRTWAHIGYY